MRLRPTGGESRSRASGAGIRRLGPRGSDEPVRRDLRGNHDLLEAAGTALSRRGRDPRPPAGGLTSLEARRSLLDERGDAFPEVLGARRGALKLRLELELLLERCRVGV